MLSPTTELQAVNSMLYTIGESPVSSVADNGVVDAATALSTLQEVSREVQARGWHFNTEEGYRLMPTYPDGEIRLPDNVLRVDAVVNGARDLNVTSRGKRLYNKKNHSYRFKKAVTVNMVVLLDFEDLPEFARGYIGTRAARIFQTRTVGSAELNSFSANDEARALVQLEEAEAETADYNILSGNSGVAEILYR